VHTVILVTGDYTLMNRMIKALAFAVLWAATAGIASAQVWVNIAPPAPIVETRPAMPGPGYAWVPGYYRWNGNRYVWVHGHYSHAPRPNDSWVPGHWTQGPHGRWHWREGHWRY
jgi:hypothetical protein